LGKLVTVFACARQVRSGKVCISDEAERVQSVSISLYNIIFGDWVIYIMLLSLMRIGTNWWNKG